MKTQRLIVAACFGLLAGLLGACGIFPENTASKDSSQTFDGSSGLDAVPGDNGGDQGQALDTKPLPDGGLQPEDSLADNQLQGDTQEPADGQPGLDAAPDAAADVLAVDDTTDTVADVAVEDPECPGNYPAFEGVKFCGEALPKKVPGMRLLFSYTGSASDTKVCGSITWKLGNRILLGGKSPDGVPRGRLTNTTVYYDVDSFQEDDVYKNIAGEDARFPFIVELLDKDRNVLWHGRKREPLQVREFLIKAMEEKAQMEMSSMLVPVVKSALGADFEAMTITIPSLPGAKYLRFFREYSAKEKATATNCATDTPMNIPILVGAETKTALETEIAAIPEVPVDLLSTLTDEVEVTRLYGSAEPWNSVNLTVLGDGYTASEKATFEADAQAIADFVVNLEPFRTYAGHLNIWSIWTPSAESGASYDCGCTWYDSTQMNCASPTADCVDDHRDTVFGSVFTIRSLYSLMPGATGAPGLDQDRNIFPLYIFRIAMAMSLSDSQGTPVSGDATFVVINTAKQGAFGLYNAALTNGFKLVGQQNYLAEVATHEMGHAFGLLGDEYTTSSDICQAFELTPLFPNFSGIPSTKEGLAWAPWATLDPPYPNSEADGTATDIGCYVPGPGGGLCCVDGKCSNGYTVCRPQKTCKMKTNEGAFCSVCTDHLVKRFFQHMDMIQSSAFDVTQQSPGIYQLGLSLSEIEVSTAWAIDGNQKSYGMGFLPFTLNVSQLGSGDHTVTLTVTHLTSAVRLWHEGLTEELNMTVKVP